MEAAEVLQFFIELCNTNSGFLQYHLAPNAALDWYGRTIRGKEAIYQYFRYDVCQQYEHNFSKAEKCDAIEIKPFHKLTRNFPSDELPRKLEANPVSSSDDDNSNDPDVTPTQVKRSPILPQLNKGRKFISTGKNLPSDDDLGLSTLEEAITPPPQKCPEKSLEFGEPSEKKFKFSEVNSYPSETKDDKYLNKTHHSVSESTQDCEDEKTSVGTSKTESEDLYSQLMYLESTGILVLKTKQKHRGVTGFPNQQLPGSSSSLITQTPSNPFSWDRTTKIKLSYRIRKSDKFIQFALIIYEHLARNSTTRRNLLLEFDKTQAVDDAISNITSTNKNSPPQIKRKTPLKRNFRLF